MTKKELIRLQEFVSSTIERRARLGGYSQEAETILNLWEVQLKIVDHLIKQHPKDKKK